MSIVRGKTKRADKLSRIEAVLKSKEICLPDFIRDEMHFEYFSEGELIRTANEEVTSMSILFSGHIFVSNSSAEGREFTYAKEQRITLLGDLEYLSGNTVYASTVIARTDVELGTISFELFDRWLENKDFRNYVIHCVASKAYKIATNQAQSKFYKPVQKVVNVLLSDVRHMDSSTEFYVVKYTHQDLAVLTGLSARTINRAIQALVQQQLILVKHGKIVFRVSDINILTNML